MRMKSKEERMSDALLAREFSRLLGEDAVKTDEPMSAHTSFRIGGPADYLLLPSSGRSFRNSSFFAGNGSFLILLWEMAATFWSRMQASAVR